MLTPKNRLAILMHGELAGRWGKMGWGMLRYAQTPIACVIDRTQVGADIPALTGIPRDVPVVASIAQARALGADVLLPGIAPAGGLLPDEYRAEIEAGLAAGMSLINGLHGEYAKDPELAALVQPGAWIWDVRKEPEGLTTGSGAAVALACRRVLTVGTDMAIGKMTASLELDRAARARGLRSRFLASGQIGICIAGDGVPLDAVRVDFASGAIEQMVLRHADNDILWIEGQGAILNPASTAWLPLMRGSMPTDLILCHRAGQEAVFRMPWVTIPPLAEVAALYEAVSASAGALPAARVAGIALNCANLTDDEARRAIDTAEKATGLPATDVLRFGAEPLLTAILAR